LEIMGWLAGLLPRALKRRLRVALGAAADDRFLRIFDASPDWIVITRLADSIVVNANRSFETISGYRVDEVVGQPMARFNVWVHPEQRGQLIGQMQSTGVVRDALVQLRRKDGQTIDCVVNCTLLALDGQEHSHAMWIARDVTAQLVAQEQFSAAFRLMPNLMTISRVSDGRYVEVNAAFERVLGYRRDEVLGRTAGELGIWVDLSERDVLVRRLNAERSVMDHFIRVRNRTGDIIESLVNVALFEAHGERYMIGILRDVTAQRRAERVLQESETRFARLFEQSPQPMCYLSDGDKFASTQWNQAAFEMFGLDPASSQGKSGLELGIWVDAEDRTRLARLTAERQIVSGDEVRMRHADGRQLWMQVYSRIFSDDVRTLMVFTFFDVTERKRADSEILRLNSQLEERVTQRTAQLQSANLELSQTLETLRMAKDQLVQSEKLAALGALVAGVAHELNTPIGNGLTTASALEHKVQRFEQASAQGVRRSDLTAFVDDTRLAAEIMRRNLERAGELVVTFKQVAVDQASSQRRRFLLSAVVGEILVTLNPVLRKSACSVTTGIAPELWLDSYPGPLGQVLTNLINNAIVHGFEAGRRGEIHISALAADSSQVCIGVADNGRGISAEDQKRVFEPFFTTKLGQGGSGLGLHIVHNIVTGILGGQIELASQPGKGASFTLTLPTTAPERVDSAPAPLA
jgi:PAS domain S-box-containing protein